MSSEWTVDTRAAFEDMRFSIQRKLEHERDRRYTEVNQEKEKALKIKEEGDKEGRRIKDEADKAALGLAREIQTYKDEKANNLRSQIEQERGTYVTQTDLKGAVEKMEATIKPIAEYISADRGRDRGLSISWGIVLAGLGGLMTVIGILSAIINFVQ